MSSALFAPVLTPEAKFLARLTTAIRKAGERCGATQRPWSPKTMELALAYAQRLVVGSGELPQGLQPGSVTETVEQRFALTCLLHKVPEGTYPGQRQDWFAERMAEAVRFWSRRVV